MYDLERLGLVLQISGLLMILGSQIWFLYRARRKYGSLRRAFLALTFPREGVQYRAALADKSETKKTLQYFPLAKFLYEDLLISVIGVAIALVGTVFELMG